MSAADQVDQVDHVDHVEASKPERMYTRADLQRLVDAAAVKSAGIVRAACRELVLREQRRAFSSRLKVLLKQLDAMPEISGVNLSES